MIGSIEIRMPEWFGEYSFEDDFCIADLPERMRFVLKLAIRNIEEASGGPFSAAVFEKHTGRLVAFGVNRVIHSYCSLAHAEMNALSMAQQRLKQHRLGADGIEYELVSSCEPCAMCLGAIPWSGISSLVYGGRHIDAENCGFDEGDKPEKWVEILQNRGISVTQDVLREECAEVFMKYIDLRGEIY